MIQKPKNQKPLNGESYLTAKIVTSKYSTFWYEREIGELYYICPTRRQHRPYRNGAPGDWYYEVIGPFASKRFLLERDIEIVVLDEYKIPEELFEI